MADAPANIEKFRLLPTLDSVPQAEFDILRAPTERSIAQTGSYQILGEGNALTQAPLQNPILAQGQRGAFPRFSWDIFPQFRQEFFDPSNPFAVQLLAGVEGTIELMPQLSLTGEAEANIYDNFNTGRSPNSALPHVRTDFLSFSPKEKTASASWKPTICSALRPTSLRWRGQVISKACMPGLAEKYYGARKTSAGRWTPIFLTSRSAISTGCSACRNIMF